MYIHVYKKELIPIQSVFCFWNHSLGDYITIANAQDGVGTAATQGTDKLCGILFNASPTATESDTATVCSYVTPFRVGVHFDSSEAIGAPPTVAAADNYNAIENAAQGPGTTSNGAGTGTNGFWLAYWQNTCWWEIVIIPCFKLFVFESLLITLRISFC